MNFDLKPAFEIIKSPVFLSTTSILLGATSYLLRNRGIEARSKTLFGKKRKVKRSISSEIANKGVVIGGFLILLASDFLIAFNILKLPKEQPYPFLKDSYTYLSYFLISYLICKGIKEFSTIDDKLRRINIWKSIFR